MEILKRFIEWLKANKWFWAILIIVLAGCVVSVLNNVDRVTETDLLHSLQQTAAAKSYRFSTKAVMLVGGKERVLSDVKGEKEETKLHMSGEMMKTPVDAYLLQNKLYVKNPWGKWLVLDDTNQEQAELYISELNPLGCLNIKNIAKLVDVRQEMLNDEQLYRFTIKPDIENPVLEVMWTDYTATLWVEPKTQQLRHVKIVAASKSKAEDRLSVQIKLWDYGRSFRLEPPIQASK